MKVSLTKDGRHKFKWLTYEGQKVRIDADIAPLLTSLWTLGIKTTNSCHAQCSFTCGHKTKTTKLEDGGYCLSPIKTKDCDNNVWIAFESIQDLEKFFNLVAKYDTSRGSMYELMNCDLFVQTTGKYNYTKDAWAFSFYMRNMGLLGHFGRPMWRGKRMKHEVWIEDGCGKNHFRVQPQLTFPRKHLPYIEAQLQLALKNRKSK